MASTQESTTTAYKKKLESGLEDRGGTEAIYRQNFFTVFDDDADEDEFIPELIPTGKDPHNHNIEVELGRDEARTGRGNPGRKPVIPLPFIKVDLNNNQYRNWETVFGESKATKTVPDVDSCLKADEPIHNDPGFMPPELLPSDKPVTFALSKTGGLSSTVFGADINDIPTSYNVPELDVHELPVVGTFVHGKILPGFSYRVRLNGTNQYLFDGNALVLEAVGQGFGKRLTFECNDLLNNKNFFWSDNNPPNGYALSMKLPIAGEYAVKNKEDRFIGRLTIKEVHDHQIVQAMRCLQDGIQIEAQVKMLCHFTSCPNMDTSEKIVGGIAIATKKGKNIQVDRIENVSIDGIENCCQMVK